jgi:hypothetical protein
MAAQAKLICQAQLSAQLGAQSPHLDNTSKWISIYCLFHGEDAKVVDFINFSTQQWRSEIRRREFLSWREALLRERGERTL